MRNILTIDEESQVKMKYDTLKIKPNEGIVIAKGDVVLESGTLILHAQEVVYNKNTKIAEISGDILIETGGDTISGESGIFNMVKKTGAINDAHLYLRENNYHVDGERIESLGENRYLVKNFTLTTCESPTPEWSVTGSEIRVTIEGYGKIKGAAFRIKNVPFFYLPYMVFSAKTERQTGLLTPQAGYSDRNGAELEIPFFWAISDHADVTLYERYISRRGFMQGIELRYVNQVDSKGTFNFDILSDRIDEKNMNDPDQLELSPFNRTNSARYWFRGKMEQALSWGVKARMDADIVSDQDYFKEFETGLSGYSYRPDYESDYGRPVDEINSPLRKSDLRLSRDSENYSFQASSSFSQRPEGFIDDTTPQSLAGFYYSMLPGFIRKSGLSFSLNSDYDYIWRDFGQKGHSLLISPGVSYPLWFGRYLQFEPELRYSKDMQWLDKDGGNTIDYQSRDAYQIRARLSTLLERIFNVDMGQTKKLKHKIIPNLLYEYRSHKDQDRYQPWFESIDSDGNSHSVAFSLDNILDAKNIDEKGNITYSQWGTFRVIQEYDIHESRREENPGQKKEPFEPLTAVFTFMPFNRVDLDAEVQWDHYKEDVTFADLALKLDVDRADGKTDIYRLDYVYNDNGNKGLSYYLNINVFRGFSIGSALQRDMDLGHDIEKSMWVEYSTQCWGIRVGMEKYDDESRIMLGFNLSGFGS
ncbi:LPS-assembly protein LptD [Thermodesulfobacteriota bacterium]